MPAIDEQVRNALDLRLPMRPLFTIHAGEHLVGEYIERHFRKTSVWVPAKDSGIDLLVTDQKNQRTLTLQVKFSRDFLVTHLPAEFQKPLRAYGWWKFNREKLRESVADYWVLLLIGFNHQTRDFIVVRPKELSRRLEQLHKGEASFQTYLWITKSGECWETRGLRRADQLLIANGDFSDPLRDFTEFLNNWNPLINLNGAR